MAIIRNGERRQRITMYAEHTAHILKGLLIMATIAVIGYNIFN